MKIKTAILGIDLQNDFSDRNGALYVPGAALDAVRIALFIDKHSLQIDYIALTLDSHKPVHIASQQYWKDREGYPPALYSVITAKDVAEGNWIPQFNEDKALPYLEKLESEGGVNTIWPAHCIVGTSGWAINSMIMKSIYTWAIDKSRGYDLYYKAMQEFAEQYSIFSSLPGFETPEEVETRNRLISKLKAYDRILIMGEAADVCVINTLTSLLEAEPAMAEKIVVLTDCMSWIDLYNERATYLFETAKSQGVRFVTSENYNTLETV